MRRFLTLVPSAILLVSCGGGGGDDGGSPPPTYTVSATVSGLQAGAALVLANNGANNTPVSANGSIAFSTPLASGGAYSVTVATQPTGATCTVTNGSGTIGNANVNVAVACALNSYTVGGTVSGLLAGNSVTLRNNAANDTIVNSNGAFTFSSSVLSGSGYAVTVSTQPPGQDCAVTNGSGTIAGSNVTNAAVTCSALSYSVRVTVSGPPSVAGLVVRNNGGDNIAISNGGTYSFATPVASGSPYAVTLLSTPAGQTCFVSDGSGTVRDGDVNVAVTCPWHIAYVANLGEGPVNSAIGNVAAYYIDATTGALSPVAGSPFGAGVVPGDVKIDPTGRFVYVVNRGTVSAYSIDATSGALTEIAGSPFASGSGNMVINPAGPFAYVAGGVDEVFGHAIDTATGALTALAGSPFTGLGAPFVRQIGALAVDPSGEFAYVGIDGGGLTSSANVATASIDPSTGALTQTSMVLDTGRGELASITVDPTGRFVYSTDYRFINVVASVRGYTRDGVTGALTPMPGSPFASPTFPWSFVIGPGGEFAYVPALDEIWVYEIDGVSGALTPISGSPFAAPGQGGSAGFTQTATNLAIDPTGAFALTVRDTNIAVHRIDGTSGALTAISGGPFAVGTKPVAIAIN
jgi:6-phosphogluconolactonase (cycloisomerase 2 family)